MYIYISKFNTKLKLYISQLKTSLKLQNTQNLSFLNLRKQFYLHKEHLKNLRSW
jgi:hypothetical protein